MIVAEHAQIAPDTRRANPAPPPVCAASREKQRLAAVAERVPDEKRHRKRHPGPQRPDQIGRECGGLGQSCGFRGRWNFGFRDGVHLRRKTAPLRARESRPGRLRHQIQLGHQIAIVIHAGIRGGEQFVAVEDRVGAGEEAERLAFARQPGAAGAERRTFAFGNAMRVVAIRRTSSKTSTGGWSSSGVPGMAMRQLIGTLSGGGSKLVSTSSIFSRSSIGFAHADDAAAADGHAGLLHGRDGVERDPEKCAW